MKRATERCPQCGRRGIALATCKHCGEFIAITLALSEEAAIEREADREMFGDDIERFGLENVWNK